VHISVIVRKINVFEKILLPIAFLVGIAGFIIIYNTQKTGQWFELIAVFSWLILIFLMIIAATNEDVKEELGIVIREQVDEIKMIKELNHDLLSEMKLLRQDMKRR
jgi:hypothetical protein